MMSPARVTALTILAMLAFAGNSLLCRAALTQSSIDAASFTSIRLLSGAAMLGLLLRLRSVAVPGKGNWQAGFALFAYAACFSFAYLQLSASTGALLLFGAVQASMIGVGLYRGERLQRMQAGGLVLALCGLLILLVPGLSAPPLPSAALMIAAGFAWGAYSLLGQARRNASDDVTAITAGNFLRALPFALLLGLGTLERASIDIAGVGYAVASGALASALGYAVWYRALRGLAATTAASVQLSVPAIAALGGVLVLGEPFSLRLLISACAILGGIALVIRHHAPRTQPP